jgi:TRAP-type C4-dicarboxylate transport system substrate-binding protein
MMMKSAVAFLLALLVVACALGGAAAQTAPAPYAQKLVDQALAKHPEVVIIAMHVAPPHQKNYVIIASNIGRIGKKADEDDMRVIETGKSNLEINKAGNHFEVELVIEDKSGKTIGAAGIVFNYKPGDDKAKFERTAEQIRDGWKAQIPNKDSLFQPAE